MYYDRYFELTMMIPIPSSSFRLSHFNAFHRKPKYIGNFKTQLLNISGMIALFLYTELIIVVNATPNQYKNQDPVQTDGYFDIDQRKADSMKNDDAEETVSSDELDDVGYYGRGNGYFEKDNDFMRHNINKMQVSTDMPPFRPGGLPLMSDGAFSLITMIYVSCAFLFVFFAFCWNNHYPKGDVKGEPRNMNKSNCLLMPKEDTLGGFNNEEDNLKQIVDMLGEYQQNEKIDR